MLPGVAFALQERTKADALQVQLTQLQSKVVAAQRVEHGLCEELQVFPVKALPPGSCGGAGGTREGEGEGHGGEDQGP